MMKPSGHSVVITAMVVATTVAVATAQDADDSSSDENLRQALVLVNILKSGILRRSQRRLAATPSSLASLADFAGYRPWPPPDATFNKYDSFRRMNDKGGSELRKDSNMTRQMEYDDPFGPHPGGDGSETPEKATAQSTSTQASSIQPPTENKVASEKPTKTSKTTVAKTKTESTKTEKTSPPTGIETKTAKSAGKITVTKKYTEITKSQMTTAKPSEITKTKKPSKMNTKLRKKQINTDKTTKTTKAAKLNKGAIKQLKYNKKSGAKNAIDHKRAEKAEIAEVVSELKREAADVGKIVGLRCAAKKPPSEPRRTGGPHNDTHISCFGPNCNEGNATQTIHFKPTTRIYLSRSVRPAIPLPANNAFCFTNPENALCRTLI